jgi:ABC-2 type transport system ATP-binding protein
MDNQTKPSILQVKNLSVNYGPVEAVRSVSFEVYEGEIFGLLGPNGAGKTSTLSAIEGLLKPASGTISVAGYVAEIIRLFAGIHGLDITETRILTLLRDVKLEDEANRRFGQLSGGQQQRVSLIIALIHNPRLVLLDEPTTGLDPQSRRQLWERIEALRENGHGILLTTHSMEEAEAVCDRIAIIDHGQVINTDTPQGMIELHRSNPEVIKASRRGKITLEDVFIGLTGSTIRS